MNKNTTFTIEPEKNKLTRDEARLKFGAKFPNEFQAH